MTAMSVDTLLATLRGAIVDGTLPFTGALVGDADLTALLAPLFDAGTVSIAGAAPAKSDDGLSVVTSGTVTQGNAACTATMTLTPGTQSIALALALIPTAPWKLASVFPGVVDPTIGAVTLTSGGLIVVSAPSPPPGGGTDLPRGMSLVAALDVGASYPLLTALVGTDPLALRGVVTDPVLPQMALATTPHAATLGSTNLGALVLSFAFTNVADAGEPAIGLAAAAAAANFPLGTNQSGTASFTLPSSGATLNVAVAFTGVTLADFTLLEPYLGAADPLKALPDAVREAVVSAGSHFELRTLGIAFDTAAVAFQSASVGVGITLDHFQPFPVIGTLTLDDVAILWSVQHAATTTTSFALTGALHLTPDCPVTVGIQTQPGGNYAIVIRQADDAVLKVSQVVAALIPGVALPELDVEDFAVELLPGDKTYTVAMTVKGGWDVLQDIGIALATVDIVAVYQGGGTPPLSGSLTGTLTFDLPPPGHPAWLAIPNHATTLADGPRIIPVGSDGPPPPDGSFDLQLVAERPAGGTGWLLTGGVPPGQKVPVGDLLAALLAKFDITANLPAPLAGLTIDRLGLRLDQAEESFAFGCAIGFPIGGQPVEATVDVSVTGKGAARQIGFGGSLRVGDLEFDLRFARGNGQDLLLGEFQAHGDAGQVNVKDLIGDILPDLAATLPDGLVIDIADAAIAMLGTGTTRKFVFAMDLALEFPLSDLPLIGSAVPADAKAGIKQLRLVVTSAALDATEVAAINAAAPTPFLPTPPTGITGAVVSKGFSMAATLELGALHVMLTSPPLPKVQATTALALTATEDDDPTAWVNVQKTIGPVTIGRVGFTYRKSTLFVLADLSLEAAGLSIELIGIGIGSPIKDPSLRFTIQGLGISYVKGPVAIAGGLIGTLDPIDFTGALSVKTPQFSLAALAGYAQYQDHPSFFLYGVLNAPLGGPPAFFVRGVAAGVGFNRSLTLPSIAGVTTFPLVQWAQGIGTPSADPTKSIGDQLKVALQKLGDTIAPSIGSYWLAAGLRFTSFELVDTFALATLIIGPDVEVALLGVSTVVIPPLAITPVAEVQLAIKVAFSWDRGLVSVEGQLTENSYILSRDCRLTGGFAFYLWFRGIHAGDTVLSLGGYNPNFTVPEYYPQVPRLGFNWKVVPELTLSGGLYFAVTPNVIMAGGKLSAVWNSGPISAWFTYWADFLMTFEPFHYYVDGGIDLGASFTVDAWLFSFSVTIHVGVDLALWGPPFAGRAVVDLDIVSFTISFGDHGPQPATTVDWSTFVKKLLPAPDKKPSTLLRPHALVALSDDIPPAVVQVNLIDGMVRELAPIGGAPCYLVNAEKFRAAVACVVPVKQVVFAADPLGAGSATVALAPDGMQPLDHAGQPIMPAQDFGVGPVGLAPDAFEPKLTLTLTSHADSQLLAIRRLTNAPKALWQLKRFDGNGVQEVNPATVLTDGAIADALVGFDLVPEVTPPDHLLPIPLPTLLFTLGDPESFAWSTGTAPATDPFTDQTVTDTILATGPTQVRGQLLAALTGQDLTLDTAVAVGGLADPKSDDLSAAPRLRLLGEVKTA